MKYQSKLRCAPHRNTSHQLFEQLESRVMLSGNITACVSNGLLTLKGDNHNNSVVIDQTSLPATSFSLSSGDGATTINGQSAPVTFNGVTGLAITVGSGNDTVVIQHATVTNNLQITGAAGNQVITLNNDTIVGDFTLTNTGGQNSTTVENSSVDGNVTVNAGAGFNSQCGSFWGCSNFSNANETFALLGSSVGNNVSISNTSGETTTDIDASSSGIGSTIGNNLTVTNGANSYGNCGFNYGFKCGSSPSSVAGDLFTLNYSTVGNNVAISNASDGNTTTIGDNLNEGAATIGGNLTVSNVVGTSNQCGFNASCSQNLANASDSFVLSGYSSIGGNVTLTNISDGASAAIEDGAFIGGGLTITNGVGSYGQGFTSCFGQTSANFGDFFTLSGGAFVNNSVAISNGSAYNNTDIETCFVGGNLTLTNGLNLTGQSGNNSCGNNSCGNNSCGNNSCGGSNSVYTTDLFTLNGGFILGSLSVSNASGYTNSNIEGGAFIGTSATLTNANGVAYFEMDSSFIGTDLSFTAGAGTTDVTITNSTIGTYATITAGRGTATVSITSTTVDSVEISVSINSTVRNQLTMTV